MRRLALLIAAIAACAPPPAAATPAPAATTARASLAIASPAPTATVAVATPSPAPSTAPTASPPAPPPTSPPTTRTDPRPDVNAHNEKQWIVVEPETAIGFRGGEAPAAGTTAASYTLNGTSLAGAALRCIRLAQDLCSELRILPTAPLAAGAWYEIALLGTALGSFTARGLVVATPRVLAVSASQEQLVVTFDRPMLHVGTCGDRSWDLSKPGTLEYVRAYPMTWPPAPGAYTSSNEAYRDFLAAFVSEALLSDDCRSVTLRSGWGAPAGSFELTVAGVVDEDGNTAPPRTFTVDIADQSPPRLMFAQLELQTAERKVIRVAYSEAMDPEYVTDAERYYLNGKPIPAGTTIACELANCAWVGLTFAPTAFVYGAENTLTIVGVRDTAGKAMAPDIVTSGTFRVY